MLKKWTFENFWTHFEVLYNKQSSEFVIPAFHDYSLGPKITKCGDPLYMEKNFYLCKEELYFMFFHSVL